LFYLPLKHRDGDCYKCKYDAHYTDISISCDKLLPKEKQMTNDIAYVLLPLERKNEHLMCDEERNELMPIVIAKYKDEKINKIKRAEVTSDTSKRGAYLSIE